jgi:hypothetical protein
MLRLYLIRFEFNRSNDVTVCFTYIVLSPTPRRVEAAALDAGLKRVLGQREVEHFDWLVRYQIKGTPTHPSHKTRLTNSKVAVKQFGKLSSI